MSSIEIPIESNDWKDVSIDDLKAMERNGVCAKESHTYPHPSTRDLPTSIDCWCGTGKSIYVEVIGDNYVLTVSEA